MIIQRFRTAALLVALCVLTNNFRSAHAQSLVGETLTGVQSASGEYISWREHLIDDPVTAGVNFSGSDGFVMGDIDKDGIEDIVSVHESDSEYDSGSFLEDFVPPIAGHVRIHYGSNDPDLWFNITLAEAEDVPA
ncbi:MAG: hypothetical protein CMD92_00695, partial [Gammaproteobacteria bacterium]|nr:hypothetical protein [Gammaproteobacteria bacterium]